MSDEETPVNLIWEFLHNVDKRVKKDETTKLLVFLSYVSAYGPNPLVTFLRGPSSTGKTYIAKQVARYFPKRNVNILADLSPKALVRDYGQMIGPDGKPFDPRKERPHKEDYYEEDDKGKRKLNYRAYADALAEFENRLSNSAYIVDLTKRIMIFVEAPGYETFMQLRPILSHDAEELEYKFADGTGNTYVTRTVKLRGWPAAMFCTADAPFMEQLATRSITHTPDMDVEKYNAAIHVTARRAENPWTFHMYDPIEERIKKRIEDIAVAPKFDMVLIPYASQLASHYRAEIPRDMRDYDKLQGLIMASTMLHYDQRPILHVIVRDPVSKKPEMVNTALLANFTDLFNALYVFMEIEEATKAGISRAAIEIFDNVIVPLCEELESETETGSVSMGQAFEYYSQKLHAGIARRTFYGYLNDLTEVGWIEKFVPPNTSGREKHVRVTRTVQKESLLLSLIQSEDFFGQEKAKAWILELLETIFFGQVYGFTQISEMQDDPYNDSNAILNGSVADFDVDSCVLLDRLFGRLFFSGLKENLLLLEAKKEHGIVFNTVRHNPTLKEYVEEYEMEENKQ